jgi:hypothetical protein
VAQAKRLARQRGVEFREREAVQGKLFPPIVAVGRGLGRLIDVDELLRPHRHLHAAVAEFYRPATDAAEGVERRFVADELREEDARTLHRARWRGRLFGWFTVCHGPEL